MEKIRGIVCEKHKNHIIFLTQNGQFLKGIPLIADPEIGEEVDFYLKPNSLPANSNRFIYYKLGPALMAAILCIVIAAGLLLPETSVAAYIHLNGNHPVEIGVDAKGKVISAEAHSKDRGIDIKDVEGLPIETALDKIVNDMSTKDAEVSITAEYKSDTLPALKAQVEKAVKKARQDQSNKNLNSIEEPSNEKPATNNNALDTTNQNANQNPAAKKPSNSDVDQTQQESTAKDGKNNSQKNSNALESIPKKAAEQEKGANPSTDNTKDGNPGPKKDHVPLKENNNQSNHSTNKESHSKSDKSNVN
ncbi:anti-sigma factor domain-containing protein [Ureibacillus aquaedulcis]|uniref:Anti-sigma factor domain-containing protein n=1 Tax=Ureibacillus aquaedulcis TaxID=3058421 RepID=A0ABT8GMK6_9BACL|nr:anti-sigma factor domain-containing protein [Ureibacillus sp. BA0131]MDN4492636.1 anti-sigma factor domain-containing protein [Ureibacillus sp. BA0131]